MDVLPQTMLPFATRSSDPRFILALALAVTSASLANADQAVLPTSSASPEADSDTSDSFPTWFIIVYWVMLIIVSLLAALIQAAESHVASLTSTVRSVLALVTLDTLAYVTIVLSTALLALASVVSRPWEAITPTFLAPVAAFVASITFLQSMQTYERSMLVLWLRTSCLTSVNRLTLDINALREAYKQVRTPVSDATEDEIIALVRSDARGGIARAAQSKGSTRPIVNVFAMWRRRGSPQRLPQVYIRRIVQGRFKRNRLHRAVSHVAVLRKLGKAGSSVLQGQENVERDEREVKVITVFDCAARTNVYDGFGSLWTRVSRQPGLHKRSEGWWFIGTEIVMALKVACGIDSISATGRFDDVHALWGWTEELGYGWRKEFQIMPIVQELARRANEDEGVVTQLALEEAGLRRRGSGGDPGTDSQQGLAVEANCIAVLGLAVRATVVELQFRLEQLSTKMDAILQAQEGTVVETDSSGTASLIAMAPERWPEDELARMIFQWVADAAVAMGRPAGPGLISND